MNPLVRFILWGIVKQIERELAHVERAYLEGWIDDATLLCLYVDFYEEARKWGLNDYFSDEYFKKRFEMVKARRRTIRRHLKTYQ